MPSIDVCVSYSFLEVALLGPGFYLDLPVFGPFGFFSLLLFDSASAVPEEGSSHLLYEGCSFTQISIEAQKTGKLRLCCHVNPKQSWLFSIAHSSLWFMDWQGPEKLFWPPKVSASIVVPSALSLGLAGPVAGVGCGREQGKSPRCQDGAQPRPGTFLPLSLLCGEAPLISTPAHDWYGKSWLHSAEKKEFLKKNFRLPHYFLSI